MSAGRLRIAENRRARKYSRPEKLCRLLWMVGAVVFRWMPRPLHGMRAILLRLFGARLGRNVHVYPSAVIAMPWNLDIGDWTAIGDRVHIYNLGRVTIGREVTVSQGVHICAGTHDYRQSDLPLVKAPIDIGDGAWLCADAFIGPHVKVGEMAVVGACAVVISCVDDWTVVAGNPARRIKRREIMPHKE